MRGSWTPPPPRSPLLAPLLVAQATSVGKSSKLADHRVERPTSQHHREHNTWSRGRGSGTWAWRFPPPSSRRGSSPAGSPRPSRDGRSPRLRGSRWVKKVYPVTHHPNWYGD